MLQSQLDRLPVTLLTGFLGSGKTTLLNRLLADPSLQDTAVLVNEFGAVGIDHHLVENLEDEKVLLLGAGCLCCTIRDDLVEALRDLWCKRQRGELPAFRRVVVETTGLADVAPLLHTLLVHEDIRANYQLGEVIATIDGQLGEQQLDRFQTCLRQVAVADCLVVTKCDLVEEAALSALEDRVNTINPGARQQRSLLGHTSALIATEGEDAGQMERKIDLNRWLGQGSSPAPKGRHDPRVRSLVLEAQEPIRIDRFVSWLEALLTREGERILRIKGLLSVVGLEVPLVVHGVQHIFHPLQKLKAWPAGPRHSRLVLIGLDLPDEVLRNGFACSVLGSSSREERE